MTVRIRQISGGGSSRAYVNAGVGSFGRRRDYRSSSVLAVSHRPALIPNESIDRVAGIAPPAQKITTGSGCDYRELHRGNSATYGGAVMPRLAAYPASRLHHGLARSTARASSRSASAAKAAIAFSVLALSPAKSAACWASR